MDEISISHGNMRLEGFISLQGSFSKVWILFELPGISCLVCYCRASNSFVSQRGMHNHGSYQCRSQIRFESPPDGQMRDPSGNSHMLLPELLLQAGMSSVTYLQRLRLIWLSPRQAVDESGDSSYSQSGEGRALLHLVVLQLN